MQQFYAFIGSKMGEMLVTATENALTGIYFPQHKNKPEIGDNWINNPQLNIITQFSKQFHEYLTCNRCLFTLPYTFLCGTDLQQKVWKSVMNIPYGQTVSYSKVANSIDMVDAVRAVASAIGKNPLSVFIPCHRVVGGDDSLSGYAAGIAMKQALLDLEKMNYNLLKNFSFYK